MVLHMYSHTLRLLDEHVLRSYSRSTAIPSALEHGFLTYVMNGLKEIAVTSH